MSPDVRQESEGFRYALAVYDGDRHVGFLPRQGSLPVAESAGVALDLFHSELGVRSQACRRAFEFAPMTIAPYDLNKHCLLGSIPNQEDPPVPVKDEEYRDVPSSGPVVNVRDGRVSVKPAHRPRRGNLDDLTAAVKSLARTQRRLSKIISRLIPDSEA